MSCLLYSQVVLTALDYDEIVALDKVGKLRSPIVLKAIDGYRVGQRLPLDTVQAWHVDHLASIMVEKDH
jgi:hypothetical protein